MFDKMKSEAVAPIARPSTGAPSNRLNRNAVRLFWLMIGAWILAFILPGGFSGFLRFLGWVGALGLIGCLAGLALRWFFNRVLWTVRSRLIVTCLLLGVAPIVLFGTLASLAAYVFCGQFATSLAMESVNDSLTRVAERSSGIASFMTHFKATPPVDSKAAASSEDLMDFEQSASPIRVTGWSDGKPLNLHLPSSPDVKEPSPFAGDSPAWLHPGFKGLIVAGNRLFLCAVSGGDMHGHALQVLACSPLRNAEMDAMAVGLGSLYISSSLNGDFKNPADDDDKDDTKTGVSTEFPKLRGGVLLAPINLLDVKVFFTAPLNAIYWSTGEGDTTWLSVISRPAILYRKLFASSINAGTIVKTILISAGIVFGLLELLACLMAFGLSRTITRSIADLYVATKAIDKGHLEHRIPVRRKDQLAALATSFNTMTTSLQGLLAEQREKDRMQSELKIAQAVQKNLFPHSLIDMPNFEVYGLCEPARTIGGDYYDFIRFGSSQLYIALGDISGKGISAALLMASLHSAVRAYQSGDCSEQDEEAPAALEGLTVSPGRMLALLNRHLYSSTQPEKYATLFLASYDNDTRILTYSNGGHLPPIVLCQDGSVKRLDCGGSVVGLLEGMQYRESTVQMGRGDLLIAYSDGLTEPEQNGEDFGDERLIATVRRNQILDLPDIAAHTMAAVKEWFGEAEQPDDMTLVLARLT